LRDLIDGTLDLGDPHATAALLAKLAQVLFDATVKRTAGLHVDYVDAKAFTRQALTQYRVSRDVPYIRLVLKNSGTTSGFRTTTPVAVYGTSAADILDREGSSLAAVQRVVLGRRLPSKAG
jgi:hypothetical protein